MLFARHRPSLHGHVHNRLFVCDFLLLVASTCSDTCSYLCVACLQCGLFVVMACPLCYCIVSIVGCACCAVIFLTCGYAVEDGCWRMLEFVGGVVNEVWRVL
jgi:hypothetical protein